MLQSPDHNTLLIVNYLVGEEMPEKPAVLRHGLAGQDDVERPLIQ